jgi:hypothetical protein
MRCARAAGAEVDRDVPAADRARLDDRGGVHRLRVRLGRAGEVGEAHERAGGRGDVKVIVAGAPPPPVTV